MKIMAIVFGESKIKLQRRQKTSTQDLCEAKIQIEVKDVDYNMLAADYSSNFI
jgi:hypothetical protein